VAARSLIPRRTDIIEAIERIHSVLGDMPLDVFETDWQRQWLVERGVGIISEASRHLTEDLKARHPEIPWQKVAGIGDVLRHNYESIAAPIIWKLAQADLPLLEKSLSRGTGNGACPQTARLIVVTHARVGFISSGCGWIALRSGQRDCRNGSDKQMIRQSAIFE
jgi:uncharacterized protein with HEPN domain